MKSDTIAAISTAMTSSGIGIVRISGDESFSIINKIFKSKKGNPALKEIVSHTVTYGFIFDEEEMIDEVLVVCMKAPRTFTTEDTVEINCHGGVYVMKRVLETVIKNGARPAEPGEFTKRAFLNGRMDLSQAESVIDLINSKNEFARKSSIQQLGGAVSAAIRDIRAKIIHEIAFIETALDDPEHISLEGYPDKLQTIVDNLLITITKLLDSADNGRILKEGIQTVIVGKPNVGKSSLLNELVGEERAIVTDIAGTTRDVLQEQIVLEGISLNIIDTAGIRETDDTVEKIGVIRSKDYLEKSDLVIYIADSSTDLDENDYEIIELLKNKKAIILLNKIDLDEKTDIAGIEQLTQHPVIPISVKEKKGLDRLAAEIKKMFFAGEVQFNDELYITNIRHKSALEEAKQSLSMVLNSIDAGMPEDFFSIDLMNAYEVLGSILGESVGEDLVNEIFSKFCTGK